MNECIHAAYDVPTGRCPDCGEIVRVVSDTAEQGANAAPEPDRIRPEETP